MKTQQQVNWPMETQQQVNWPTETQQQSELTNANKECQCHLGIVKEYGSSGQPKLFITYWQMLELFTVLLILIWIDIRIVRQCDPVATNH